MEKWKAIKDYEGHYDISNQGRVRSLKWDSPKILKFGTSGRELYRAVVLSKDGTIRKFRVSRLVAEAFINNPLNKPCVNHINGVKTDNRVENLEWCTRSENDKHAFRLGLRTQDGEGNSYHKLSNNDVLSIREHLSLGEKQTSIAKLFGVGGTTISNIKHGLVWKSLVDNSIRSNIG